MFEIFKHLSGYGLPFGAGPRYIATLMTLSRLDYGIESFWVAMIIGHGLVVALTFFVTLLCLSFEVARGSGRGGAVALVSFFAVASTSLRLPAKSPIFAIQIMLIMLFAHANPDRRQPRA